MNYPETTTQTMSPTELVDQSNTRFYERFPFPWRPGKFEFLTNPDFQTAMFNQNLGDWQGGTLPEKPAIWVAGCGTNQALITALTFPKATVVGSDLSSESLKLCDRTAKELAVKNLELRGESINGVGYAKQFDYVICDGVIHCNADPGATLNKLVAALKPKGIMELMVYNRYERLQTTAFQRAIKIFSTNDTSQDLDRDIWRAKHIVTDLRLSNFPLLRRDNVDEYPECALADTLIQPNEVTYTLESFEELALASGLEVLYPACDLFDQLSTDTPWNLSFTTPELQHDYYDLPDLQRWHVTNHLLLDRSPQLWFYFQRKDSGRPRLSERAICADFLKQQFVRTGTLQRSYIRAHNGAYRLSAKQLAYPLAAPRGDALAIYQAVDGKKSIEEIITLLGQPATFEHVNNMRLQLTTTAHPHLRAVRDRTGSRNSFDDTRKRPLEELNLKKLRNIRPKPFTTI